MSLLDIRGLSVRYGDRAALAGIDLTVAAGEIVGLVGESGSGKSTLALAAIGLLPSATIEGDIAVDGQETGTLDARACDRLRGGKVGMVFQEPARALDPLMTIGAQVAEAVRAHRRCTPGEAQAAAGATLARCGLDPAAVPPSRYPHQLSGGQRQRVGIAIAIAARPKLLIADEPTSALDTITQAHVMALLRRLVSEDGMGLLLISHDLALVAANAARVVVMRDGRIVETGDTATLLAAPRTGYVRQLIAAAGHRPSRPAPSAASGSPLLEVEGLVRRFGRVTAVNGAGFAVQPGESVGIIGASGAGKTSLLRLILGLDRPDEGVVRIDGVALATARGAQLRTARRAMQAVFQDPAGSFDPRHSVARIVAEPLHLLDGSPSPAERHRLVADALAAVGLSADIADRLPHRLSGGQRQRVAIARALIVEPRLVVLDEPVSALDAGLRATVLDLLARIGRERGLAMLIVGHDLGVMRAITDRLLVMDAGVIVEEGATATVLADPRHAATRALVEAAPRLG